MAKIDSRLDFEDELTHEIFSILESKFFVTGKSDSLVGKVRLLSIDATGSTDGVLAAKSLAHLESLLKLKSGNPQARVSDFFDVAAGSGVGGVLASLLFTRGADDRPVFTADEALDFLVKNRRKLSSSSAASTGIFRRRNGAKKLEKIFRRVFGESTLRDTLKPVLISCYDLTTRAPFLFSRADAFESDGYDFAVANVCVATLADPTAAVGSVEMRSVDKRTKIVAVGGGLATSNPTAVAITHALNNKHEFPFCNGVEDLLVVSLGNGESSDSAHRDLNVSPAGLVQLAGDSASDMVDQAVSKAFGEFMAANYIRIQANGFDERKCNDRKRKSNSKSEGKELLGIAEAMLRQKNVESVLFSGKKVVQKTNLEKLDAFAGELIKEHERRKSSIIPFVLFKQASARTSSATISTISSY